MSEAESKCSSCGGCARVLHWRGSMRSVCAPRYCQVNVRSAGFVCQNNMLFPHSYEHRTWLQVLRELPTNLAVSVLQVSAVPLNLQLPMLPEDLHGLALQASLPDIVARGCLSLDLARVGIAAATAALSAFPGLLQQAQQTAKLIQISLTKSEYNCIDFRSQCEPDMWDRVERAAQPLVEALISAFESQPESVDISGIALSSAATGEVLQQATRSCNIRHFGMCMPKWNSGVSCVCICDEITGNMGAWPAQPR